MKKIKRCSAVKRGASPRPIDDPIYFDDDGDFAWVRISDVTASDRVLTVTEQTLSRLGATLSVKVEPGDLFLSIAATVGKPIIAGIKCCIHDGFVYFPRLTEVPEYLFYVFASGEPYKGLGKMGTQLNLNTDTVGDIQVAWPPVHEQRAIATFLDRETARLDGLIEKRRSMIALLQEKRAALITHAVTRGLDPDAPLKDSGIEWLGRIPKHWHVLPLKRRLKWLTSGSRGWAEYYADEGKLFLRIGNLTRDSIDLDLTDTQFVEPPLTAEGVRTAIAPGDLLLSITAFLGSIAVAPSDLGPAFVSQHVALARPHSELADSRWLAYCLLSQVGKSQLEAAGYGGTKVQLGLDDVKNLLVVLPPVAEQRAIAAALEAKLATDARSMKTLRLSIDRLTEYRASLITAAVTGQIDVRALVP